MKIFMLSLLLLISCSINQQSRRHLPFNSIKIIALMGQSQMEGRGDIDQLPDDYAPNKRKVFNFVNGEWITAVDPLSHNSPTPSGVGPGITLASDLSEKLNSDIGIIQCAKGSTSIDQWRDGLFQKCMELVDKANQYGELIGVFWMQGESDSYSYQASQDWGWKFTDLNSNFDVPVIYAQAAWIDTTIHDTIGFEYWDDIKATQAATNPSHMITSDDLTLRVDGIHLSTASEIIIGHRFADKFMEAR